MADRTVTAIFRANVAQYQAAMAQMRASTRAVSAEITRSAAKNKQDWTQLGVGVGLAGAAVALGIGKAVSAAADFDREMSNVAAVSGATAAEMGQLREAALAAGKATVFSASESAKAQAELTRAGISTADVLGGALTGALDLAAAGQLDLTEAATVAAQALNVFDLAGSDTAHVADVLAAGANKSAADVSQLGQALRQGGLVAAQYGVDLETTVGTLAMFADNALIGSDAGTSFKAMLQRLVPQSDEAQAAMDAIGFSAFDASGKFVGLESVAEQLRAGLSDLSDQQRAAALNTIFGADAVRAASVLYSAGEQGVREYAEAVNDQGAASRNAATQLDNLRGDIEEFSGSVEAALIEFGEEADGALRKITQFGTGVVNALADLPDGVQAGAVGIGALGSAAALAAGGFLLAAPRIVATRAALDSLSTSMPRVVGGLRNVGGMLKGPWGLAIGGAVTMVGLLMAEHGKGQQAIRDYTDAIQADSFALGANTRAQVVNRLEREGLLQMAQTAGVSTQLLVDAIMDEAGARDELNAQLSAEIEAYDEHGRGADAAYQAAFRLMTITRQETKVFDEGADQAYRISHALEGMGEEGGAAQWRLAESGRAAAEGMTTLRDATDAALPTLDAALDPVDELTAAQKALNETLGGFVDPMGSYQQILADKEAAERETAEATAQATEDMDDSWEDYFDEQEVRVGEWIKSLEGQEKAAERWQRNMMILASRVSDATLDELARMGPEGAPLVAELVNASDKQLRRLDRVFRDNTGDAVDAAREELEAAAPVLRGVAEVAGRETAEGLARQLANGTASLARIMNDYGLTIAGGVNPILEAVGKRGIFFTRGSGAMGRFAEEHLNSGGWVVPGARTHRDTVRAALTPGEFVHTEAAVDYYGADAMYALNRRAVPREALRGYATGGFVTESDVPRPPSFSPLRMPLSTGADAAAEHMFDEVSEFVRENARLPAGAGWQAMYQWLTRFFPEADLISGFRPGARTATGRVSNHARGLAIDTNPWMAMFDLIARTHPDSRELIFSPAGGRQLYHGQRHFYGEPTRGDHWDHIHWALNTGGLVGLPFGAYDAGGMLPEGLSLAFNGTGRPEPVGFNAGGLAGWGHAASRYGIGPRNDAGLVSSIVGQAMSSGSLAAIDEAIRLVDELTAAWERQAESEQDAARRAELVRARAEAMSAYFDATRTLAKADQTPDSKKERRALRDAKDDAEQATEALLDAQQAVRDFDDEVRTRDKQRRIERQRARLEAAQATAQEQAEAQARIDANRAEAQFAAADRDEQLAILDDLIAAEVEYTDEWVRLVRQRDDLLADEARERQDAAEEAVDRLRQLVAEEDRLRSQLTANAAAHSERVAAADRRLAESVADVLSSRRDALEGFANLSERVTARWGNSTGALIRNTRQQTAALAEWARGLQTLRDRGLSEDIIAMMGLDRPGAESFGQVRALLSGTESDIAEFNAAVVERSRVAGDQVAREQANLYGDVGRQLVELRAQHMAEMDRLQDDFLAEQEALSVQLQSLGTDQGVTYGQALEAGLRSTVDGIRRAAAEAQAAMSVVGTPAQTLAGTIMTGGSFVKMSSLGGPAPRQAQSPVVVNVVNHIVHDGKIIRTETRRELHDMATAAQIAGAR